MKRKTTIKLTPFTGCDLLHNTNCQICNKVKLLQKGIIGTQKLKSQKICLGRTNTNTNIWTQSALETSKEITQPDFLPKKLTLTLKDFEPGINPHLHLCVCSICEILLRKPLMMNSYQHVFYFICLHSFLKSKAEDSNF